MKSKNKLLVTLMGVALLVGCQKELEDRLVLLSEGFASNGSKMAVSGNSLSWVTGDEVRVNGQTSEVTADASSASIPMGSLTAPFRAIYPASLNSSAALNSNTVTLTFPSVYTYHATDGGQQNLEAPMAAYAESGNKLFFKHLTGALTVAVDGWVYGTGISMKITSITVISDRYQLSGSRSIDFSNLTSISPTLSSTAANRSVTMVFDEPLYVGPYTSVQIPLLPVGENNKFTVEINVRYVDGSLGCYKITRSTNSGAIGRAKIGQLSQSFTLQYDTQISKFSVSANRTVRFAKGNLQYRASTDTWRLAEHQYDIVGSDNSNISSSNSGWIDLFGWGTSGWNGSGATCYHPYDHSTIANDYCSVSSLTGSYRNADWGYYNRNNIEGLNNTHSNLAGISDWRTLTYKEWDYILNTRTGAANKKGKACIDGQYYGLVLLPDNWTLPSGLSFTSGMSGGWSAVANNYSLIDWVRMEDAGAVFLPTAGYRYNTTVTCYTGQQPMIGYYWTATKSNAYYNRAYDLIIEGSGLTLSDNGYRECGEAVRLVRTNMTVGDADED